MKKGIILAIFMITLFVAIGVYAYTNEISNQDCTIGFRGTAASVELHGYKAQSVCDTTVKAAQPDAGPPSDGTAYYETGSPQGTEICSGTWNGLTYTVRDSGLFDLVGNEECTWFTDHGASYTTGDEGVQA